jgi:peroxiredoxin (alkyl hydroperoxide reductase subunit C)
MILPGEKLPAFRTTACVSIEPDKEFRTISSGDFPGRWLVLYTYPKDFTFVCPTEIVEFDRRLAEFAERSAVVLGASTDNEHSHLAWRKEHALLRRLEHPLLFLHPDMARNLGVLHPSAGVAVRATFIVDPDMVVRFSCANDLEVGRSVDEVLRVLDGLQTGELVACSWKPGEKTLTEALRRAS